MSKFSKVIENHTPTTCSCGQHHSLGTSSPHERAQMYNWFRNRYERGYEAAYKRYLESYEREHGKLAYDDFLPKVKEVYLSKQANENLTTHWQDNY